MSGSIHIWDAAKEGDLEGVEKLLQNGLDVNSVDEYGATALHYAARHGR